MTPEEERSATTEQGRDPRHGALRDAIGTLATALTDVQHLALDAGRAADGDLAGLSDLLTILDRGTATAVALTERLLTSRSAMRSMGLPFEGALAILATANFTERRKLAAMAEDLRHLPVLNGLWQTGKLSTGTIHNILSETRRLPVAERADIDARFKDVEGVCQTDPDDLVERVRRDVDRKLPRQAEQRELRTYERRFVAIQPSFDGALSFYGELDPESGATFLEALQAASPPPVLTDRDATTGATAPEVTQEELEAVDGPFGTPGGALAAKVRGRQNRRHRVYHGFREHWLGPGARRQQVGARLPRSGFGRSDLGPASNSRGTLLFGVPGHGVPAKQLIVPLLLRRVEDRIDLHEALQVVRKAKRA
jgi:hypothetical protein